MSLYIPKLYKDYLVEFKRKGEIKSLSDGIKRAVEELIEREKFLKNTDGFVMIGASIGKLDIKEIDEMVKNNGLYKSRSEMVRIAIKDFIIRRIEEKQKKYRKLFSSKKYVRVPVDDNFKTKNKRFRILRIVRK